MRIRHWYDNESDIFSGEALLFIPNSYQVRKLYTAVQCACSYVCTYIGFNLKEPMVHKLKAGRSRARLF